MILLRKVVCDFLGVHKHQRRDLSRCSVDLRILSCFFCFTEPQDSTRETRVHAVIGLREAPRCQAHLSPQRPFSITTSKLPSAKSISWMWLMCHKPNDIPAEHVPSHLPKVSQTVTKGGKDRTRVTKL